MEPGIWILLICSAAAGITGMLGLRKDQAVCLVLSAMAMPATVFAALWFGFGFDVISLCFCIIALCALWGIRGRAGK